MATPEGDASGNPEVVLGRDESQSNASSPTESFFSAYEWSTASSKIPDDAQEKARKRKTYASFGDGGTTASVNAYGHIIQISRFLNHGRSGLFCVDLPETPEPYLVQRRMERLVEISDDPHTGLRLEFESEHEDLSKLRTACPSLEFIHDRWPLYTPRTSIRSTEESARINSLSVQYFCDNGTVFQKYTWKPDGESLPPLPRVKFSSDLLIRDLDFVDPRNHFNDQDLGYFRPRGSSDSPLILLHQLPLDSSNEGSQGPNGGHAQPVPGLIMAPFAYDEPQEIRNEEGRMHEIAFTQKAKEKFLQDRTLEITMAYRLELKSSGESWDHTKIEIGEKKATNTPDQQIKNTPYQRIQFSSNRHLDFVIRRNLEHILSVCSVPVSPLPTTSTSDSSDSGSSSSSSNRYTGMAIALTCGDFSGHRISSGASFYAFQFLVSMLRYLNDHLPDYRSKCCRCQDREPTEEKDCGICEELQKYLEYLRLRIQETCLGHLRWICQCAQPSMDDGQFAPHYWATGEVISDLEYLPPASLADTPFQLLKISDYYSHFQDDETFPLDDEIASVGLKKKIRCWIKALDSANVRGKYAFPRKSGHGVSEKFYLRDHVLICGAIQSVQDLKLEEVLRRSCEDMIQDGEEEHELLNVYCFEDLRKAAIKRFTTENPFSKQRMLAARRTSSESRFLFHSKDTALFHAMELGFFKKEGGTEGGKQKLKGHGKEKAMRPEKALRYTRDVWKNAVDAQSFHDDYQDLDWTKPLWYALVLIMTSNKQRVNTNPAESVFHDMSRILMGISSSNGLFPGLLDETQEPTLYEDELKLDIYWHTTFELPYILWMYGRDHLDKSHKPPKDPQTDKDSSNAGPAKDSGRMGKLTTKTFPFVNFNSLIDQKGLVEVSDDWLQDGPKAVDFSFKPDFTTFEASPKEYVKKLLETVNENNGVIRSALDSCLQASGLFSNSAGSKGAVIDIPKNSDGSEIRNACHGNHGVLFLLEKQRTVQDAKKRFIWLPSGDKETALLCYLASPDADRGSLSSFLDKHEGHKKYFFDGTIAAWNVWETELHLSSFRLIEDSRGKKSKRPHRGMRTYPNSSFVKFMEETGEQNPGGGKTIVRETMSFRFVGDFFDRHWTCHFLDHDLQESGQTLENRLEKFHHIQTTAAPVDGKTKFPWQQRKVLELLLFNQMIKEIKHNTRGILYWAQENTLQAPKASQPRMISETQFKKRVFERGRFSADASIPFNSLAKTLEDGFKLADQGSGEEYFSIIERWRLFEQILQAVEDDLRDNLEIIKQWTRREADREPERPRWTKKDEKAYRPAITKLTVLNQRKIQDLEYLRTNIKTFRDSLTSRLASIREEISFRGSENINLFTYVTVVFLPLGFATGIFSMSNAPSRSTLISMVELALIAMALTIFALANAKTSGKKVVRPVIWLFRRINDLVLYPVIVASYFVWNLLSSRAIFFFCRYVSIPLAYRLNLEESGDLKRRKELLHDIEHYPEGKKDPAKAAVETYRESRGSENTERPNLLAWLPDGIKESRLKGEVKEERDPIGGLFRWLSKGRSSNSQENSNV